MIINTLPEVLNVHLDDRNTQVVIELHVQRDLDHFPGHFPGLPLLPGVVQIDWASRFAHEHFPITGKFSMMENIKFQALLLPDACVELTLTWDKAKDRIEFVYASLDCTYSSGRIVFGMKS